MRARIFSHMPEGAAFWYENVNGLAEIAVTGGCAYQALGLSIGVDVKVIAT
ncbi:MAG: hypothetical protein O3B21_11565 [Proteobacteria bacterium]|nr:hypothetical protein [Pseudomonadota bacterium]MDA1356165.1 hypothetical protein [Pseudomonadota bacterium]